MQKRHEQAVRERAGADRLRDPGAASTPGRRSATSTRRPSALVALPRAARARAGARSTCASTATSWSSRASARWTASSRASTSTASSARTASSRAGSTCPPRVDRGAVAGDLPRRRAARRRCRTGETGEPSRSASRSTEVRGRSADRARRLAPARREAGAVRVLYCRRSGGDANGTKREESRSSGSESLKKYLKEISRLPRVTPAGRARARGARSRRATRRRCGGWSRPTCASWSPTPSATAAAACRSST